MKKIIFIAMSIFMITSCTDDTLKDVDNSESMSDELLAEREILKETSFLVGKLLNNPDVRNEVITKMKIVDERDFNISLHALMGHESFMTYKEQQVSSQILAKNNQNHFKEAFVNELSKNEIEYPSLAKMRKSQLEAGILKSGNDFELGVNAKIYIPFLDVNEDEDDLGDDFYISYDPLTFQEKHEGYRIDSAGIVSDQIEIDFDYINNNRVVGIVPIDPCEFDPLDCGYHEAVPLIYDELYDIYHTPPSLTTDPGHQGSYGGGSWCNGCGVPTIEPNGEVWEGSGNTQNPYYLLATNENHTDFNDEDFILTTEFAAYSSKSAAWMRMWDRYLKLRFHVGRGTPLSIQPNGTVVPGPQSQGLVGSKIKRGIAGSGWRWYTTNNVGLDLDWSLRKVNQQIFVFTRHNIASNANVTRKAKFGVSSNNGNIVPVLEDIVEIDITIGRSNAKFRASTEITRNLALQYNVGSGPLNECRNIDGHCFFVHKMHHTEFILRHYLTPKN